MMPLQNVRTTATAVNNVVFMQNGFAHTFLVWPCSLALAPEAPVPTQRFRLWRGDRNPSLDSPHETHLAAHIVVSDSVD